MNRILVGGAAFLLAACATARWYPPATMTPEQARMEDYRCQQDATMQQSSGTYLKGVGSPYASGYSSTWTAVDSELYEKCLQAHGWTRQERSTARPADTQRQITESPIVTSGWNAPEVDVENPIVVVWSDDPIVTNKIKTLLLSLKKPKVVERARLETIMREQVTTLTHGQQKDSDILKVGALAGANIILFADVTKRQVCQNGPPCYFLNVAIRGVLVETGQIGMTGDGTNRVPTYNPDEMAGFLAFWAFAHAMCRLDKGYEWHEPHATGSTVQSVCQKRTSN